MHETIPLDLTRAEMLAAGLVGLMRQMVNHKHDAYGAEFGNPWGSHVLGAIGELAVAKWLNMYWHPHVGRYDADDVGPFQIRTSSRVAGDLILHPRDADAKPFILVTGVGPRFYICGWCLAAEGKLREYWRDPAGGRPAFFVPARVLHDPRTLPGPRGGESGGARGEPDAVHSDGHGAADPPA